MPAPLSADEINNVVNLITADDDLDTLESDFQSVLEQHNEVGLTDLQKANISIIWQTLQNQRLATWNACNPAAEAGKSADPDFQIEYVSKLAPVLLRSFGDLKNVLNPDQYNAIFGLLPTQATQFLLQK